MTIETHFPIALFVDDYFCDYCDKIILEDDYKTITIRCSKHTKYDNHDLHYHNNCWKELEKEN